jgi:hypothetical protein
MKIGPFQKPLQKFWYSGDSGYQGTFHEYQTLNFQYHSIPFLPKDFSFAFLSKCPILLVICSQLATFQANVRFNFGQKYVSKFSIKPLKWFSYCFKCFDADCNYFWENLNVCFWQAFNTVII